MFIYCKSNVVYVTKSYRQHGEARRIAVGVSEVSMKGRVS